MNSPAQSRRTPFLGQAILILTPLAVLAVVGLLFIRQDRILAQQEARERAQTWAEELVSAVRNQALAFVPPVTAPDLALSNSNSPSPPYAIQVDAAGNLLYPRPYPLPLTPNPLDLSRLNQELAELWQAAQSAAYRNANEEASVQAWRAFLAQSPPEEFAATATLALGTELEKNGQPAAAAEAFATVSHRYPRACGESGLPLKVIADWHWLALQSQLRSNSVPKAATLADTPLDVNSLCAEAITSPTLLTPLILERAEQLQAKLPGALRPAWREAWAAAETERAFYRAALPWLKTQIAGANEPSGRSNVADFTWLRDPQECLAFCLRISSNYWIAFWPEAQVRERVQQKVHDLRALPPYFGATVQLAGRSVLEHPAAQGLTKDRALATALDRELGPQLQAAVFLLDPRALFARQRVRSFWFGMLILISAVTAVIGLASAYRAFRRQERLTELKSNFVSSVSHELRAPIASLRLMAEGLERGRVPSEEKKTEYFRFIVQECRRLSALIENVLDFSRIEQGRKQYEFEPTDLRELASQTAQLMQPYAGERGIILELQSDSGDTSAIVQADGRALQQALVNLIDNAVKHSPEGSVIQIGVRAGSPSMDASQQNATGHSNDGRSFHELHVEDHGEGIPPEDHSRIFERFYRRGSELQRHTQGVGLGLAIVKHIVEAHGGRIHLRSAVGQGSRFTIQLPSSHLSEPLSQNNNSIPASK